MVMNKLIRRMLCAIALISCFALPALADSVTFTDVSGGSYSTADYTIATFQTLANEFTATVSGALSGIDVAVGTFSGTNTAIVSLYDDAGGNLGATPLFQGTISGMQTYGND